MMPGLTMFVLTGTDVRLAASTLRAARTFLKGVDTDEVTASIHGSLSSCPQGAVALSSRREEVFDLARQAAHSDWVLLLQPGDRLSGDAEAVGRLISDSSVEAIEWAIDGNPIVPNPTVWPTTRLVRTKRSSSGTLQSARSTVRAEVTIRPGAPLEDPVYRTWALGVVERDGSDLDLGCALFHAGFLDAALSRLLDLARSATDPGISAPAARYSTMVAMSAGRPNAAKRPLEDWLRVSGRSQPALVWSAIVEMGRDHPAAGWQALSEAIAVRATEPAGMDPIVLRGLAKGLEGMLAARQSEALRYREVLRTATDERRRRAAMSLTHAWAGSGLDPAEIFRDLDPDAIAAMEEALGSAGAIDADIWLETLEAFLDHGRLGDNLAERVRTAAASSGVESAATWSARLRAVGLARFCPLMEIARISADPVDRVVAASIASTEMNDTGAGPLLRQAARDVPSGHLAAMVAALERHAPAAVATAVDAAATTVQRRAR